LSRLARTPAPAPCVVVDTDNIIPVAKRRNSRPRYQRHASRREIPSISGMGPCLVSKGDGEETSVSLSDFELYHVLQCLMNSTFYRHCSSVSFQNKQMLPDATNRPIIATVAVCCLGCRNRGLKYYFSIGLGDGPRLKFSVISLY
jgi:hypothetical protein